MLPKITSGAEQQGLQSCPICLKEEAVALRKTGSVWTLLGPYGITTAAKKLLFTDRHLAGLFFIIPGGPFLYPIESFSVLHRNRRLKGKSWRKMKDVFTGAAWDQGIAAVGTLRLNRAT